MAGRVNNIRGIILHKAAHLNSASKTLQDKEVDFCLQGREYRPLARLCWSRLFYMVLCRYHPSIHTIFHRRKDPGYTRLRLASF
jgi:hypothetical protein